MPKKEYEQHHKPQYTRHRKKVVLSPKEIKKRKQHKKLNR